MALVQLALLPPPEPEQVQVELPPHDPATFAVLLPVVQLNCVALLQTPLTGQAAVLQLCDSVAEPLQLAPPLAGAGLVQVRLRVWVPPPQLTEQLPQLP